MKDRSQSKEIVVAFDKYCCLNKELEGAVELFQEAGSSRPRGSSKGSSSKKGAAGTAKSDSMNSSNTILTVYAPLN